MIRQYLFNERGGAAPHTPQFSIIEKIPHDKEEWLNSICK
jgi:hypothetical protein